MSLDIGEKNGLFANILIDQLVSHHINYFCMAYGSRNTPLIIAAEENSKAITCMHFDERGLGFHGLGYAKSANKPASIIVTSGTASGNLLPAIMEASSMRIPMIIITADRPNHLRLAHAHQSTDQVKMFSNYVKWQIDISAYDAASKPDFLSSMISHALFHAKLGPVHINCMFEKPLFSRRVSDNFFHSPPTSIRGIKVCKTKDCFDVKEGIILVGNLAHSKDLDAIFSLSEHLNWPIFADILSNAFNHPNLIHHWEFLLGNIDLYEPSYILHFGDHIISRKFLEWIQKIKKPQNYTLVADNDSWYNPTHLITHRYESDISLFILYAMNRALSNSDTTWLNWWQEQEKYLCYLIDSSIKNHMVEPSLIRILGKLAPVNSSFFFSNSMPIRDADLFFLPTYPPKKIYANRGLCGIDGNIATCSGIIAGSKEPLIAVIGDMASLHDLNSFALLRTLPILLIIFNNQGGGIFSHLPIKNEIKCFEKCFEGKHFYSMEKAAEMFTIDYQEIHDSYSFKTAIENHFPIKKPLILEVFTKTSDNIAFYQTIREKLHAQSQSIR